MSVTPGELVGLPEGGPTTLPLVKVQLSITDNRDDARLSAIVDATNNLVRSWPISQLAVDADEWPERIVLGTSMLAARFFRRKNSPAGVEAFGQLGAAYVMRSDPDIAQLLSTGSYQLPQLG